MDIPYPLFQAWNGFLSNTPRTTSVDQSPSTSGGTSQELLVQNTYTDLLECSIPGNSFGFSADPVIRTEIHKNPQRLAGTVIATNIRRKWVTDKAKKKKQRKNIVWCPPRSFLGPLLFLLYINDICRSSRKFNFYSFADDTNLLYTDKNLKRLCPFSLIYLFLLLINLFVVVTNHKLKEVRRSESLQPCLGNLNV